MARIAHSRSPARPGRAKKLKTAPRKEALQARSQETVETILRATTRILVREGYDALSTNRVAAVAGVSIGSLYQYFPNKESLVAALLHRHLDETQGMIRREAATLLALPVEQAVRRFVELMIAAHRVDPALHRVFVEQIPRIGALASIETVHDEGIQLARTYLEHHRTELRPIDLDLAAFLIVTTIESVTHGAVLSRPAMLERADLVDETAALVTRFLVG